MPRGRCSCVALRGTPRLLPHPWTSRLDPAGLLGRASLARREFADSAPQGQRFIEADHRLAGVAGGNGVAAQPRGRLVAPSIGRCPASVHPEPSVSTTPSPRVRRRAEMCVWSAFAAVRGGSSPHSSSISVSADTTEPPWSPSIVRMARGLAPGMANGAPFRRTWRGPKTPSSTA